MDPPFLICGEAGEAQVVSFSIIGVINMEDVPKFGNSKGRTCLLVAVDDGEKSHLSLVLDLDKYVDFEGTSMTVWHHAALTRGKRGPAKRADVLNFVAERAPHLVDGKRILLGTLPCDRLIQWSDAEQFICNCIEYALIRDEYRRQFSTDQNMPMEKTSVKKSEKFTEGQCYEVDFGKGHTLIFRYAGISPETGDAFFEIPPGTKNFFWGGADIMKGKYESMKLIDRPL